MLHRMLRIGSFYAAESAVIVGDVAIGADSSVWHQCVIRGDVAPIRVGERVSVQDGSVLHCKLGVPLAIEDEVVIGHGAVVHCKRVGRRTLVGIHSTILDDSEIGEGCLIAAGAVVPPGTIIPPGMLVMGMPAKVARPLKDAEKAYVDRVVKGYVALAQRHAAGEFPALEG